MRLYRNLTLVPKYLGFASVSSTSLIAKQPQFHSTARQLIRIEPFRSCGIPTPVATSPMTKVQAIQVVHKLDDAEREALRQALNQYESDNGNTNLEGEVTANRWAARVRSSDSTTSGDEANVIAAGSNLVDTTVNSGEVTANRWAARVRSSDSTTSGDEANVIAAGSNLVDTTVNSDKSTHKPTRDDLTKLMLVNAVPFLGFGFLDNFFMIIAGDYIEHTMGLYMCISTMAAAGLGNTISDVLGLGLAHHVETFCTYLGLRPPKLSKEQLDGPSCRRVSSYGRALGITIGCILGMCPLLFMNKKPKEKETNETLVANVAL